VGIAEQRRRQRWADEDECHEANQRDEQTHGGMLAETDATEAHLDG
jgi:hypothetical protein